MHCEKARGRVICADGDIEYCDSAIMVPGDIVSFDFSRYIYEGEISDTVRRYYDLPKNVEIAAGYGATDLLSQILHPSLSDFHCRRVACTYPYFTEGLHQILTSSGLEVRFIVRDWKQAWSKNADVIREYLKDWKGLFLLANPDNPTGCAMSSKDICSFVDDFPDVLFVVDEAFILYKPDAALLPDLFTRENLGVVRSFSKGEGLAGLRLGFLFSSNAAWLELIRKSRVRYFSELQVKQLHYLTDNRETVFRNIQYRLQEKERIIKKIEGLGFKVLPSATHFILVDLGSRDAVEKTVKFADKARIKLSHFIDLFGPPYCERPLLETVVRITPIDNTSNSRIIRLFEKIRNEILATSRSMNKTF